ncbi:MAG: DMT family transporter [Gammaproteobacteria bacterium]|nr:DMT family transporter [Gammaproteobacteria bacterium]
MHSLQTRLSPTLQGMLLMVLATIAFTSMQSGIRVVANDADNPMHPIEVAFFRNLFGLLVLVPALLRSRGTALRTRRFGMHLSRATIQASGMLCFFTGVTMIPISEVTALSFSAPLFATLLAALILGERVRMRRISALVIGFAGVVVVLRPGLEAVSLGAGLILASSLSWSVAMIIIKSISRTDSALTLTLYAALLMSPITLVPALFVWTQPSLYQLLWLAGIGGLGTIGHMAFAHAFKIAEMSAVLPLDFLRLLWASVIGYLLFSELPTTFTWMGGLMIFAAASYIAFREAQLGRQRRKSTEDEDAAPS